MIFVSKEKGIDEVKHNIIAGIVIIALVACFVLFNILTEKEPVEYFSVMGIKSSKNALIEDGNRLEVEIWVQKKGIFEKMHTIS